MGDLTLGCLLGQYGGAQSFDVASAALTAPPSSWQQVQGSAVSSLYYQTGPAYPVHSSDQSLMVRVFSLGTPIDGLLRYSYAADDDAFARWFPAVETHAFVADAWALSFVLSNRDAFGFSVNGEAASPLPYDPAVLAHVHGGPVQVYSGLSGGAAPFVEIDVQSAFTGSGGIVVDDVIAQIDRIALHPTYDAAWQQHVLRGQARTQAGQLYSTLWGSYFAYSLPLQYLPDSHAALIDWWWRNQLDLCLALDTSDAESLRLVRIVNDTQPIGKRMTPYADLWQGVLQLESLDAGSLVF